MSEWKDIPKRKLERVVFKLQKRIYKASQRGDFKAVRRLQKTLIRSWSARCLAAHRITQDNQEEKRSLVIHTMYDRALQALVKQALEPEWEARFEPNSYGFRPGRSCHDAIGQIFTATRYKAKYVLVAEFAKCFDCIDHKALLEKLNTFPFIRRQVRAWLKAGLMDKEVFCKTSEGTLQGGVISLLLANIALHGMETLIKQIFLERTVWENGKSVRTAAPDVIRYANVFVVLHEEISVVQRCQQIIAEWLTGMSLELEQDKTRLTHTLHRYELQEPGFDFLGFSVKQHPCGKYQSGKFNGTLLGFKTTIKPSKKKLKVHQERISSIIDAHKSASQEALIKTLNPVIRGWANYYSTIVSKETYEEQDHLVYQKLKAWANRRHPNKNAGDIAKKYWQTIEGRSWRFATKQEGNNPMRLLTHGETPVVHYAKVEGESSSYNGD